MDDCVKKHPYHPPPPPPKNPCLSLLKELNNLQLALGAEIQKALAPLQKDLQHATGGEKVALLGQIKAIRADLTKNSSLAKQIAAKQKGIRRLPQIAWRIAGPGRNVQGKGDHADR